MTKSKTAKLPEDDNQLWESEDIDTPMCPRCECCQMIWETCHDCGGDGYRELYEEDPLWYDIDDIEDCDTCNGKGGFWICDCDKNGKHKNNDKE